jgi:hypothetical protein
MVGVIPTLLLPRYKSKATGSDRREGGVGPAVAGVWYARAGEENGVGASAAALGGHESTRREMNALHRVNAEKMVSHYAVALEPGLRLASAMTVLVDLRN